MGDEEAVRGWLARADEDAEAARVLRDAGLAALAAFHAQQAAEKALKGVAIARGGPLERTHDLKRLAQRLNAPSAIHDHAEFLAPLYVGVRYPDTGGGASEEDAVEAIRRAEEVLEWCRTQISSTRSDA